MNKKEWNEGLDHIDPEIVENYTAMRDELRRKRRQSGVILRLTLIAAALALIASGVFLLPMMWDDGTVPLPDMSSWEDSDYSAEELAKMHGVYGGASTNAYKTVYAGSAEYLYISPLPDTDYLPIYKSSDTSLTKSHLQDFVNEYLERAVSFFGFDMKDCKVGEIDKDLYVRVECDAAGDGGNNDLTFYASSNSLGVYYQTKNSFSDSRIKIGGKALSVLESDTDDEIKEKLKGTVVDICKAFGKEYTDITVLRSYSEYGLTEISVILYTPAPVDVCFTDLPRLSDSVSLRFYPDPGEGTAYHWGGSADEAFLTYFELEESVQGWNEVYTVSGNERMLTPEEAEALLYNGYVFGGHSCPVCMAQQDKVSFEGYDYVDVEYIGSAESGTFIPFYAFYKYIGESKSGIVTYAKTYVPAIEVSGLGEYFEKQAEEHVGG